MPWHPIPAPTAHRPATQFIPGGNQAYAYTYDTVTGQIDTLTYPSGLVARYVYTPLGYLAQIKNDATGAAIWTANARDAEMDLTQSTAGNGVVTTDTFDPQTGLPLNVRAGPLDAVDCQDSARDGGSTDRCTTRAQRLWRVPPLS